MWIPLKEVTSCTPDMAAPVGAFDGIFHKERVEWSK